MDEAEIIDELPAAYASGIASLMRAVAFARQDPTRCLEAFRLSSREAVALARESHVPERDAIDRFADVAISNGLTEYYGSDAIDGVLARALNPPAEINGHDIAEADWVPEHEVPPPPKLLPLINIRAWHDVEPRPRQWIVRDRIPDRNVTLLSGQGGIGKTLLMQQLAVATVLGRDWIGSMPEFGPVLFLTAEDDDAELHFRYARIAASYASDFNALADNGLNLMSLAGKDATMAFANNRGIVKPTELFAQLQRTAREIRPRWIGLDTAADIFVVNERDRSQVRQCISLLRGLCLEIGTAVILLSHPSLTGISSGSGLSGSTAWNNSVRSRLYLKSEKKKENDDDQEDMGGRILEFMKSNYSALAAPVKLIWRDGLLVPEQTIASLAPIDRAALEQRACDVFLALLARFNRQDMTVSRKEKANNFAPTVFSREPEVADLHRSGVQRRRLMRHAMDYLLSKEKIVLGKGPRLEPVSKQNECLYVGGTLL